MYSSVLTEVRSSHLITRQQLALDSEWRITILNPFPILLLVRGGSSLLAVRLSLSRLSVLQANFLSLWLDPLGSTLGLIHPSFRPLLARARNSLQSLGCIAF
jgi:hypothetical protein